ncbi:MAG TPA: metal-dependent hydrolase [Hyphomicrobium sp.]|nr:metal-dependent hydrolase [Hyphomicrobium sp.]
MANFSTHIGAGTVVAGALATLTLAADVVAPENLVAVTMAGVLGSVLPDIDLKDSRPSRLMFAGLAVFFSFAVLFNTATKLSVAEMWIAWLGTLALVRYGLHTVFHRLSIHRGIWHSLLAGAFCSAATAVIFYRVLGRHEGVAWLAGGFMFIGYVTHLVLDEMYSVDVMDTRIKASFGTALKLIDKRNYTASAAMAGALALAIMIAPPTNAFVKGIGSTSLWSELQGRLLPAGKWFGVLDVRQLAWGHTDTEADGGITTGSITPAPSAPAQSDAGAADAGSGTVPPN